MRGRTQETKTMTPSLPEDQTEKKSPAIFWVVVPCFNEEEVIEETAGELRARLMAMIEDGLIRPESRVLFVDDGSRDGTWEILRRLVKADPLIAALRLRGNGGHQNALYAGLMEAKDYCHVSVSMDADLQDDPDLIPAMVEKFYEGNDIVYAVRKSRRGEGLFKRASAFGFYRFMEAMGASIPKDCGDFRLMSREAIKALSLFGEDRPFLRGLVPLLGFPSAQVTFDRRPYLFEREAYPPDPHRGDPFVFDGRRVSSVLCGKGAGGKADPCFYMGSRGADAFGNRRNRRVYWTHMEGDGWQTPVYRAGADRGVGREYNPGLQLSAQSRRLSQSQSEKGRMVLSG